MSNRLALRAGSDFLGSAGLGAISAGFFVTVAAASAPARTELSPAETKKPADVAPKPAEPRKQEPARSASLFDIGPAQAATSVPTSNGDDEEEILAEAEDDEQVDELGDLDDAA